MERVIWYDFIFAPVAIAVGFFTIQLGITRPENMEKPKMKMFRAEFISAYWKYKEQKSMHEYIHD